MWKSTVDKRTINELCSPEINTMLNRDIIADRPVVRSIKPNHEKSRRETLPTATRYRTINVHDRPGLGGIVEETRCEIFVVKGCG